MVAHPGTLLGKVLLRFETHAAYVPADLSAAATLADGTLVLAADERASLEYLSRNRNPHVYTQRESECLAERLGFESDAEVDIEGLASAEDGALYLVGSHSAKRKKPRGNDHASDFERLATVKIEPARFVLARVQVGKTRKQETSISLLPTEGPGSLVALLHEDAHLAPFLQSKIPGKDNGFDIEGLALYDGRLLLGLRGPVLRGWAFVLDFELSIEGERQLALGSTKRPYVKHALDLDGLGIRDLLVVGDDVLVLAGPTMALDGVHRVYRWCGGAGKQRDTVVKQEKGKLEPMFEVPFTPSYDRAEGLTLHSWFDDADSVLVLYDAPSPHRCPDEQGVLADVFAI